MILYAESSAVLAWLLGEPQGVAARDALTQAELILASELTLVECDRVVLRAVSTGRLPEGRGADLRARLSHAAAHWVLLALDSEVLDRARRRFPSQPVRTLDALHLASALAARSAVPDVALLSTDDRVRGNGRALGFQLVPGG